MDKLTQLLASLFEGETIIQMVFGAPRKKSAPCRKVALRPILLRGLLQYQAEYHYEKKVTHENISKEQALDLCGHLLTEEFKQRNLFSAEADYQILAAKPERPRITKQKPTKSRGALSHNQEKQYIIADGEPCDFLIRLGVMTVNGQVVQKHYGKFRQINRFLEIAADVLSYLPDSSPGRPIKIIDFGCGKAYLTFALYYFLNIRLGKNVDIVGLDLKEDVIEFCGKVAADLGYNGLRFQRGDIAEYDDTARADAVVTLHACDTATDFALIKAVRWNASVILSVPCCQHELFDQIENEINAPILKQGILKERFSAILTDALRALKMEEHGYDVSMIEFTSLEHTAKNIMLRCVRRSSAEKTPVSGAAGSKTAPVPTEAMKKARREYDRLKEFWNVTPSIDQMD